jgi:CRISPR-associated endonuclease/helicase Cas3
VIDAGSVRPGDLLILPTTAGGCDQWGWNPGDARPVRDLGFEANQQQREKNIVRLGQEVFAQEAARSPGDLEPATRRWASALKSIDPEFGDQQVGLRLAEVPGLPERYAEAAKSLRDEESNAKLLRQSDGTPLVIVWDKDDKGEEQAEPAEPTTEDDSGSTGPRAVPLPEHSRGVREFAKAFVTGCGLENTVARDVELAAYLHDAGKGHPEFQCWLYGGDELAAAEGGPIAKSERPRLGKRARERSGLAEGARHEVASLAFALAHPKLREANDPELVLWLIGTHHGWGRPFFPPVKWPTGRFRTDVGDGERESTEPVQLERLMARWVDLQAELTKRYGHWGLAHLEAIVRLADHRRSQHEREQEKQRKKGKRDS